MQFVVQAGVEPGKIYNLESGHKLIVGRQSTNDIIVNDEQVSRKHAQIELLSGGAVVTDLGSSNGTYVNGARITSPVTLQPGDNLQVGTTILKFLGAQIEDSESTRAFPGGFNPLTPPKKFEVKPFENRPPAISASDVGRSNQGYPEPSPLSGYDIRDEPPLTFNPPSQRAPLNLEPPASLFQDYSPPPPPKPPLAQPQAFSPPPGPSPIPPSVPGEPFQEPRTNQMGQPEFGPQGNFGAGQKNIETPPVPLSPSPSPSPLVGSRFGESGYTPPPPPPGFFQATPVQPPQPPQPQGQYAEPASYTPPQPQYGSPSEYGQPSQGQYNQGNYGQPGPEQYGGYNNQPIPAPGGPAYYPAQSEVGPVPEYRPPVVTPAPMVEKKRGNSRLLLLIPVVILLLALGGLAYFLTSSGSDLPAPPNSSKIELSSQDQANIPRNTKNTPNTFYTTTDDPTTVANYYTDQMVTKKGYSLDSRSTPGSTLYFTKGDKVAAVYLTKIDKNKIAGLEGAASSFKGKLREGETLVGLQEGKPSEVIG